MKALIYTYQGEEIQCSIKGSVAGYGSAWLEVLTDDDPPRTLWVRDKDIRAIHWDRDLTGLPLTGLHDLEAEPEADGPASSSGARPQTEPPSDSSPSSDGEDP